MNRRTLLVCGSIFVVVCLIGPAAGLGVEPGQEAAAGGSQAPGSNPLEAAAVQAPGSGGSGYADAPGTRLGSSAAESISRPGGVSYQYDALGRIKEIVRVPGQ